MMRKGEEARACRTSFSSKGLTMRVLKRSSAAVIVLLLFFASLPGAKGVQQGKTQNRGGGTGTVQTPRKSFLDRFRKEKNPPLDVCDIPEVNELVRFGHFVFPAAPWVVGAAKQGLKKEMDDRSSKKCKRKKDIEEIGKKANEKIWSASPIVTHYCRKIFHTLIDQALIYTSKKTQKEKEEFCNSEDLVHNDVVVQNQIQSCETLYGLVSWVEGLPICKANKANICSKLVVLENIEKQRLG